MDKHLNLGKYSYNRRNILALLVISLLLVGCSSDSSGSSIMFLMEKTPEQIDSIGSFLWVWFLLQISLLIVTIPMFFLGPIGFLISIVIHLNWIITERDYGGLTVFLLFIIESLFAIVLIIPFIKMVTEYFKSRK